MPDLTTPDRKPKILGLKKKLTSPDGEVEASQAEIPSPNVILNSKALGNEPDEQEVEPESLEDTDSNQKNEEQAQETNWNDEEDVGQSQETEGSDALWENVQKLLKLLLTINPDIDNKQKTERRISYLASCLISLGAFMGFFASGGLGASLLCYLTMTFSLNKVARYTRSIKSSYDEQVYETEVAQLLTEKFPSQAGTKLYSILDKTKAEIEGGPEGNVDMLLYLPSGKSFALKVVNVIDLEGKHVKVFYVPDVKDLQYRKGRDSRSKFIKPPITYLKKGVELLRQKRKDLFQQFPILIVVLADPMELKVHPDTPLKKVEGKNYLKIDGVYVVKQNQLVKLIKSLNPLKPKPTSGKSIQKP
jgi:hypothetical protein